MLLGDGCDQRVSGAQAGYGVGRPSFRRETQPVVIIVICIHIEEPELVIEFKSARQCGLRRARDIEILDVGGEGGVRQRSVVVGDGGLRAGCKDVFPDGGNRKEFQALGRLDLGPELNSLVYPVDPRHHVVDKGAGNVGKVLCQRILVIAYNGSAVDEPRVIISKPDIQPGITEDDAGIASEIGLALHVGNNGIPGSR